MLMKRKGMFSVINSTFFISQNPPTSKEADHANSRYSDMQQLQLLLRICLVLEWIWARCVFCAVIILCVENLYCSRGTSLLRCGEGLTASLGFGRRFPALDLEKLDGLTGPAVEEKEDTASWLENISMRHDEL